MAKRVIVKGKDRDIKVLVDEESEAHFTGWILKDDGSKGEHKVGWIKNCFEVIPDKVKVVISESKNYICISVCRDDSATMSWEFLQGIKDEYYPNLDFIEVYPSQSEVINKANERHLICVRGLKVVKLGDLEEEAKVKIIEKEV